MIIAAMLLAIALCAVSAFAAAPPDADGRFANWFQSKKNPNGQLCCSQADGRILSLAQVREGVGGGWEVQVPIGLPQLSGVKAGQWIAVPAENVLYTENPTGQPVAWFYMGEVRCFVPPPLT